MRTENTDFFDSEFFLQKGFCAFYFYFYLIYSHNFWYFYFCFYYITDLKNSPYSVGETKKTVFRRLFFNVSPTEVIFWRVLIRTSSSLSFAGRGLDTRLFVSAF